MIPLLLQIKNFMSYGPQAQTIDFSAHHLMCLVGKNGHGKSALLDAITWVVWGQARKASGISKADEGLLRLGESQMMVSFDCICNNIHYRIRREYSIQTGKGQTQLDFGIVDPQTKHVRSLTDKTIRATQKKIIECMGLDYDSFVNSAFIRQGHANEFSKKSPRDRKEILGSILGLDRYETLRKKANEKARTLGAEDDVLAKSLELLEKELTEKKGLITSLAALKKELDDCIKQEKALSEEQQKLTKDRTKLSSATEGHIKDALVLENLNTAIKKNTETFNVKVEEWRVIHRKKLAHEATKKNGKQHQDRIKELKPRIEQHRTATQELTKLQRQLGTHTEHLTASYNILFQNYTKELHTIQARIKTLESQKTLVQNTVSTHQKDLQELEKTITENQKKLGALPGIDKKRIDIEQQFERRKTYYHTFVAQGNALSKEAEALANKQALVCKDDAACPLCKQSLSAKHRNKITTSIKQESSFVTHRLKRLARVIKQLKELLVTQHKSLDQLTKQQNSIHQLEQEHKHLNTKHTDTHKLYQSAMESLGQIQKEMESETKALKALLKQKPAERADFILADATYKALQEAIKKHEQILSLLAKSEQEYHNAVQTMSNTVQEHSELQNQLALQHERAKEIHELNKQIKKLKKEAAAVAGAHERHTTHAQKITALEAQQTNLTERIRTIHTNKEHIIKQKSALESHLNLLEQKEQTKREIIKQRKQITEHKEDFTSLAQAFGKDGIQALLIEEAIPEIESDANELLGRLTDNQAHIMIESLRDLKSGSTRETLDIKISDPLGIRPYELFSGGEAFRIDFALRIAISKLLAKRAGASLQLLIIDEGFGSQDEEGLSNIMDAIHKIQDDFAKVIVVSHLNTMKDQFPTQLNVLKTPQGSIVRTIEQG